MRFWVYVRVFYRPTEKVSYDGSYGLIFKFRVIPLWYLDFSQLVQIFYFILDKNFD